MGTTRSKRKSTTQDTDNNNYTKNQTTSSNSDQLQSSTSSLSEGFNSKHYQFLSENENYRYMPNSKSGKVGHAVIVKNDKGEKIAYQYAIPDGNTKKAPKVEQLKNIQEIFRYGMTRYKAETLDRTPMYAKRYLRAKVGTANHEEDIDIAYFSPSEKDGQEPFWGDGEKEIPLFRTDLSDRKKKELEAELNEIQPTTKGGDEMVVDHESVRIRDANKKRTPNQNQVMDNESARDAYAAFFDSMTEELSPDMKFILKRSADAPLRKAFYSNYRPEWLHGEGFSLTPISQNPQRKDNLGAAPKWANTEMMVLERIAKWFALNRPESYITIKPLFEMLLDSELIKKIHFEVYIEEKQKFIRFLQDIDPFKKYPLFRKPSDLAQGAAITYYLLHDVKPISEQKILTSNNVNINNNNANNNNDSGNSNNNNNNPSNVTASHLDDSSMVQSETHDVVVTPQRKLGLFKTPRTSEKSKSKQFFPTHLEHEKSIVQLLTTSHEPDYDEPWVGTHVVGCSGTGLVITHKNKKYILTNAHCVENQLMVRVRLANDRKQKYEAKPICISYQCDLALLEVADPEFNELAQPVELGEMIKLQDKVQTIGFPMGGLEISISKGIVSRIEVRDYCMSGLDMLQVQVDAAINPGNSGGPVFSDGKVVGVAFQGYDKQGLGYMIPIPIIKHFLKEVFNGKEYRGFPILPITLQRLVNPRLREYYGMTKDQTGMRISKIDFLCDAYHKLKPDDILLEIDGYQLSNEGTVEIPGIGNCIDFVHLTHMKFIGDNVQLKVLRKNAQTNKHEVHTLSVTLDCVPLETEKVPQTEHDKMPTYFIASGISFVPLSRNYMEGKGSELEDYYLIEESCLLGDAPKKTADEQIVIINDVLDCAETQGYGDYENSIVKTVNGKPINNIRDVIAAIESNKEALHCIVTTSNKVIAIKNMSVEEHAGLLKRYKIPSDRSEDLLQTPRKTPQLANSNTSNKNEPGRQFRPPRQIAKKPPTASNTSYRGMDEGIHSSDEEDHSLTLQDLPGHKKYLSKIGELEKRYEDFPVDEDVIADDAFYDEFFPEERDQPLSSANEEDPVESFSDEENESEELSHAPGRGKEEEDEEDEEEIQQEPQKSTRSNVYKLRDRNRLFHKDSSQSDNETPLTKRLRR